MSNYIEIKIENISTEQSEILIAQLAEIGFDGFEEGKNFLSAFIDEKKFQEDEFNNFISLHQLNHSKNIINQRNWNEEWEKNFEQVIVDDFVAIRADFHKPIRNVTHEIIITPKMSFGTGHHATTFLMMQQMRQIDFTDKAAFDFGTGTGILAILAEKLGAASVTAIDNDEWSIANAGENIQRNDCKKIRLQLDDHPPESEKFNIILANINKTVIVEFLPLLSSLLFENGQLLVSGLLKENEDEVTAVAIKSGLKYINTVSLDKWIAITFEFKIL